MSQYRHAIVRHAAGPSVTTLGASMLRLLPRADDYRGVRRTWRGDLIAGATVAVLALPLALAFGITSGLGADAGLVTAHRRRSRGRRVRRLRSAGLRADRGHDRGARAAGGPD
jgi:hypothetical protein